MDGFVLEKPTAREATHAKIAAWAAGEEYMSGGSAWRETIHWNGASR